MQSHFFASDSGDLFDTRKVNWSANPLRKGYCGTKLEILTGADLRATLRAGGAAWPGGYTIALYTADGEMASVQGLLGDRSAFETALRYIRERNSSRIIGAGLYQEGPTVQCCYTNVDIESDYGDVE